MKFLVVDKDIECVMIINELNFMEEKFIDLFENLSVVDSNGFRILDEGDESGENIDFFE